MVIMDNKRGMSVMVNVRHALLAVALLLGRFTASAEVVQIDGVWYDIQVWYMTAEVTAPPDGTPYADTVVIPTMVNYDGMEYKVVAIADAAFRGSKGVTSVSLPDSLVSIGDAAFEGCISLDSIVLPSTVNTIGDYAFCYCSNLDYCAISDRVASIERHAFKGCTKLRKVRLGRGLKEIAVNAFSDCQSLEMVICRSPMPPKCRGEIFSTLTYVKAKLAVPTSAHAQYRKAIGWSGFYIPHDASE